MLDVIKLTQLTKQYDDHVAVNQLNLTIKKGEVFGLLGPNGAGKTTTILMMLGLTERTSGEIEVLGFDPSYNALQIKSLAGYMPDDIGFYDDRTAIENVVYTAMLNGQSRAEAKQLGEQLLIRVGLDDVIHKPVSSFSRGMRQRLGLADVLIKRPQIIILDEPTLGIDPEGVRELLELISRLSKEEGITVLLSSHHLQQVQKVCDRVGLFVKGELLACGTIDELAVELSKDEAITIQITLKDVKQEFKEKLNQLAYVLHYDCQESEAHIERFNIYCSEDQTSELTKLALGYGQIVSIQRQHFGLDDIYHRFFTGGEKHDFAATT